MGNGTSVFSAREAGALYARLGSNINSADSPWPGLFTRPAFLALEDEIPGGVPVLALNRACRMLFLRRAETDMASFIDSVAVKCGFNSSEEFRILFKKATGWTPEVWNERFSGNS